MTADHPLETWGPVPILEVTQLRKFYGDVVGVDGVSFAVEPCEIFGFLGPNGAGKTTTIRLLLQLLHPDAGRITLFGHELDSGSTPLRDRIGYLPGDFRPHMTMSGARFLAYMSRFRKRPPALREELIERLQLTRDVLDRPLKHLSHGNRQKIGIVLALEHQPELAILDEPTLGLDPLMQEAFYDILRLLRERGTTLFLSSHVLSEVEKVCARVAIIRDGKLVALESLEALKERCPRRLIVRLRDGEDPPAFPGTRLLRRDAGRHVYLVEGALSPVLGAVARAAVQDVVLPEPDLEDVFMAYYAKDDSATRPARKRTEGLT